MYTSLSLLKIKQSQKYILNLIKYKLKILNKLESFVITIRTSTEILIKIIKFFNI